MTKINEQNHKLIDRKLVKDEKKHKKAEESNESEWEEVILENQKYRYKIITEYDENIGFIKQIK